MKLKSIFILFAMASFAGAMAQGLNDTLGKGEPGETRLEATEPASATQSPDEEIAREPDLAETTTEKPKEAAVDSTEKDPALLIITRRDTALVIRDADIREFLEGAKGKIEHSRKLGYGGAGGTTPGVAAFQLDPVRLMIQNETRFDEISFPGLADGYTPVLMSGGMGYGGLGNGLRVGGGGWGGRLKMSSSPYTGDSVAVLDTRIGYGGLLIEKVTVKDKWNYLFGGVVSWGSIAVMSSFYERAASSAFEGDWDFDDDRNKASASFTGLELHGGATYTLLPWMHVGGDANALIAYSANGFGGTGNAGFPVLNPGFRFRIVFGNLG